MNDPTLHYPLEVVPRRPPWNKNRVIGQKAPFKLKKSAVRQPQVLKPSDETPGVPNAHRLPNSKRHARLSPRENSRAPSLDPVARHGA